MIASLKPFLTGFLLTNLVAVGAIAAELKPISQSGKLALDLLGARCSGFYSATAEVVQIKSADATNKEQSSYAETTIAELNEASNVLLVGSSIAASRFRKLSDREAVNQVVDARELFKKSYLSSFLRTGLGDELAIWENPLWKADAPECGEILDAMNTAKENAK